MTDEQFNDLLRRVEALERQSIAGPPRLGPRPLTPEEESERTQKLAAQIKAAVEKAHQHETDHEGRQICTTSAHAVLSLVGSWDPRTGQCKGYIVLCEEERRKGFVRPYRDAYKHLTCGTVTTMGRSLSETYARDPNFYSHTFCVRCNRHPPVSEFVWTADGQPVGS